MCGFMGAIGFAGDLDAGLPWLSRRGPDSHNAWSSSDNCVNLLHCRLAIVDTDLRANQPFTDARTGIPSRSMVRSTIIGSCGKASENTRSGQRRTLK